MNLEGILEKQRAFFATGKTLDVNYRIDALKRLYASVKSHENDIAAALYKDLGKSDMESYICETGLTLSEISYMIRHAKRFARRKIVPTPLTQFASVSYIQHVPYGNVLIMSPWNYPFLLSIEPLCDAITAGNTVILKPSAYSPNVSSIIKRIVEECFEAEYAAVITGGRKENSELLNSKFDMIFFTGSQNVGKEVLRKAAENLTPAVLELGGKSPCIIDSTAKLKLAAKRIAFGKFLNCGQTCVAPDYILCEKSVKDQFAAELKAQIEKQFGSDPLSEPDYGKIINEKHFDRISSLIDDQKVLIGGKRNRDTLQIEPTVMDGVTFDDAVMQQEIFGPVLPIITYENFDQIYAMLQGKAKPLALYIFSEDRQRIRDITSRISYGGGCVNDVVIHLATSEMGFGGVGESGMGSYHGKAGFDAFSHRKSILDKKTWMDLPMRYRPYKRSTWGRMLKMFLK